MAGGAQYGICKYSAHPDVALDFLKYMTSQKGNELLTTKAGLIPITIGADLPERMRPFMPDPVGYVSKIDLRYGNYMQMRYNGELERYMSGQSMNYDQFVQNVESALLDPSGGDRGWAIEYDTKVRWARNQERALATQSIRELMDPAARDAHDKYIRQMLQQVRANNGQDLRYRFEQVRKKMIPEI